MTFTWWRLSSPWKQGLGTMSLTYSKGCCMIWLRGSWSLTRHRSTSSGPYRRSLKLRSELYRTRTSNTKGQRHVYLVHSLSYWWWLIRMKKQGYYEICDYIAVFCINLVFKRTINSVQVSQERKHHTPWLFFFSEVFIPSMCTCFKF